MWIVAGALAATLVAGDLPSRPAEPGAAEGRDRVFVELRPGMGRVYPPSTGDPRFHFQYGGAVSAVLRGPGLFKATLGVAGEHVVGGWVGEPATEGVMVDPVRRGRYRNTIPGAYQGQYVRGAVQLRAGAENSFAFGYLRLAPGYVARLTRLDCAVGSCGRGRAVDHGFGIGLGFGALFRPWRGLGVGVDLSLESAYFPRGHQRLPEWNNGVAGTLVVGWSW